MAGSRAREVVPKPQVATVNLYEFTVNGVKQRLSEPEYKSQRAKTAKTILLQLSLIEDEAQYNRTEHKKWMKEVHGEIGEHWYNVSVGEIADIVGGAGPPPPDSIWSRPNAAIVNGRKAAQEGRLDVAARQLQLAFDSLQDVRREWLDYMGKSIEGGETSLKVLTITRNVSFAIALSAAAIVAAPVVAGAAGTVLGGGLGLTGASLTGATFVATTGVITVGGGAVGGVLRGGSNLAGQALTGDKINVDQALDEGWEGVKRGAVDAGSTVVGGGVGELLGAGAKGISLASKVVRGAGGGAAGGGFGGFLGSTLEGKSAGQVVKDTFTGAGTGLLGGGVGAGVSGVIPNAPRLVQSVAGGVVGSGIGAGSAYLSGAKPDEIWEAGISAGVQGLAMGQATHGEGFGFGKGGRTLQETVARNRQAATPKSLGAPAATKLDTPQEQQQTTERQKQALQDEQAPSLKEETPQRQGQNENESAATKQNENEKVATQETATEELPAAAPDEEPARAQRKQEEQAQKREAKKARQAEKRAKAMAREAEVSSQRESDEQYGSDADKPTGKRGGIDRDTRSDRAKARQKAAQKLARVVEEAMAEGSSNKSLPSKQKLVAKVIKLGKQAGLTQLETNSLVGKVDEATRTPQRSIAAGYAQEEFVRGMPMQPEMDPRAPRAIPDARKGRTLPSGRFAMAAQNLKANNLTNMSVEQCVRVAGENTRQAVRNEAHIPVGNTIELQYLFEPRGSPTHTPAEIMARMNDVHFRQGSPISAVHYGNRVFRNPNLQ